MASSNLSASPSQTPPAPPPAPSPSTILRHQPHDVNNGTNLIARAEALNAFMRMQPAANQARLAANNNPSHGSPAVPSDASPVQTSCLCFGRPPPTSSSAMNKAGNNSYQPPTREYYPDNLSVQPTPHPWEDRMEWLIIACIDLLESHGLHEHNLFAVSAVNDIVRQTTVPHLADLPIITDPHVAAGVIKAKIRHADEPLVDRAPLRLFIDAQNEKSTTTTNPSTSANNSNNNNNSTTYHQQSNMPQQHHQRQQSFPADSSEISSGGTGGAERNVSGGAAMGGSSLAVASHSASTFRESYLAKTIDSTYDLRGPRRAYILARFMRLLGRVSANVEKSRMNSHSLAKCVAPSMLHWDPNTNYALLMLGRITAYVMTMIEDARVFDESLCQKIDQLAVKGAW